MKVDSLGHVVLKVSNLQKAEDFYHGVLGMEIVARFEKASMTFFSLGNHHDLAIQALGDDAEKPGDHTTGLAHVAFKIGNDLETLVAARQELEAAGIKSQPIDHEVTKSLYFEDPDGNTIELYIDASDVWKKDPQRVAQVSPLEL